MGRLRRNVGAFFHIVDTLETAAAFGLKVKPRAAQGRIAASADIDPYNASWDEIIVRWLPVEFANELLNRSMGKDDLYPFVLSEKVLEKLNDFGSSKRRRSRADGYVEHCKPKISGLSILRTEKCYRYIAGKRYRASASRHVPRHHWRGLCTRNR